MNEYQEKLKNLMNQYAHFVYRITKKLPSDEKFGLISQMRRAGVSIMLNYIEGYARIKNLVKMNFWEISYGSCQESKYLLEFVRDEGFISDEDYGVGYELLKEVGAMLWSDVSRLSKESK